MVMNSNRKNQGGDVEGTEATAVADGTFLKPLMVAKASYNAGYGSDTEDMYDFTPMQLKTGFASYGKDKTGDSED
jgi:hypothetical protein